MSNKRAQEGGDIMCALYGKGRKRRDGVISGTKLFLAIIYDNEGFFWQVLDADKICEGVGGDVMCFPLLVHIPSNILP